MEEDPLADKARRFLKGELKKADVTYDELAKRLSAAGMPETKASIASKLKRGSFPATFFLASLKAVGCQRVSLEEF